MELTFTPALSLSIVLLCFIISTTLLLLRSKLNTSSPLLNLPPCPPKLPLIGNLHQLGTLAHRSLRDLAQKHGPLMLLRLGQAKVLVVSSPEMAREIMKNQDLVFADRPSTTPAKALLYGCRDVGFARYGEYWRQVRKLCVLDLLSVKRVQTYKYIREVEISRLVEKIARTASVINLSEMLSSLSNNVVARCTFGSAYEDEDGKNRFGELAKRAMRLLGTFSVGDFFPSLGWIDVLTGLEGRLRRTSKEIDVFFDGIIDRIIDEHMMMKSDGGNLDDRHFLIDRLILAQRDKTIDAKLERENLKAIMMDMFIGGTDTTATTTEWAMTELIKNPKEMKKVQEEVRRVVGKKLKVEEDDIQHMNYLNCILKETLRLHAPAPLLAPREAITSTTLNGYHIPAKTRVFINAWAIHRDSKVWDRAEEFVPERFLSTNIDFKGHDFEFIPFGSGRRSCPGVAFGLSIVELVLSNLLYWFDWKLPQGVIKEKLDMTEVFGLTVSKKTPLLLVPTLQAF
ncbi:hypothetical protein Sjap_016291 [Stephania japonica]|uniref:Cytochrome P450 n=1 Tax=Stephania japonica TaxID=461633 RepID=A0AAP0IKS7_9MAGN